jgi:HD-like signal output (HDOD) protein
MPAQSQEPDTRPGHWDAFTFVKALAAEASAGRIEIPAFPDVAMRIRHVLADDNCDAGKVAKVVSAEPALAARLLHMANSAAFNRGGARVTELKTAIARIGFANVRTASLAHAMEQLRNADALEPIRQPLNALWERSVKVAAMSHVAARRWTRISPDHALLAGLMHAMGRLYIMTRAANHPGLFADAAAYQQIVNQWQAPIARLVLESWEMAPDVVDAVEKFENPDREPGASPDLTDVLAVAYLLASFPSDPEALEAQLAATSSSTRLGLTGESVQKVLQESADELASLHAALGG